jgi:Xaa-Pro aminopeptidase
VRRRIATLVACASVWLAAAAAAGELQEDLKGRRARLMERLGPESLMVLWSAPERTYSLDVTYEYRQDSNLYYLTGLTQAETILVLMPGNASTREVLFVRDRDAAYEHWNGRILSHEEAAAQTGIAAVYSTQQFLPFVQAVLDGRPYPAGDAKEFRAFFEALEKGTARLWTIAAEPGQPDEADNFIARTRDRFTGFTENVTPVLRTLREVKTPYEQRLLERSADISSEAHLAGLRAARPGAWEYEVEAAIEHAQKIRGAFGWAYPSIVASGPNATVLHYSAGSRQMQAGDLLLVDAAANHEYMSTDIARTYPVDGAFTPLQRDLYRIVLAAQDEATKLAVPGATMAAIHDRTVEVIKAGLMRLGLITDASSDQYRTWYTHGSVHGIGIDVHDPADRFRPLEPGMAFVIEPGIYIRQAALDALPKTAANGAFIAAVRPAFEKYRNMGIRIEDSFLLTDKGLKRLSSSVPRTVEEIERFMRGRIEDATSSR